MELTTKTLEVKGGRDIKEIMVLGSIYPKKIPRCSI